MNNHHQRSKVIQKTLPCPNPKCHSSDAYHLYDDGHGFCFSCNTPTFPPRTFEDNSLNETSYTYQYVPLRGLTENTLRFFDVQTKVSEDGTPLQIAFPYPKGAKKVRSLSEKTFFSVGAMSDETLFGMNNFSAGQHKAITITEGEIDALSVYQMLGSKYPVVSVRSSSSASKDCSSNYEFLNSFDRIYLCLDNDENGRKATNSIARLFDFNKVYHVALSKHKDANEYLVAHEETEFRNIWYNAKRFLPEGVVSSAFEFNKILDDDRSKVGFTYPFPTLQDLTYGLRTGECTLFTALEGVGKTEILRAIEYAILKETDDNIGIIHLEESKARSLKGLVGYYLNQPVHLPDSVVSSDDIKASLQSLCKRDDRLHLYSHFGSSDPEVILSTIRFLVTSCHCKYIFLDHITMVVTGLASDDERKTLDYISTKLATMVEELDFSLVLVSHVNDDGLTRGSRNISKIASTWIHLDRDITAETDQERNKTFLTVRKNRFGSRTGPAGVLYFNPETFTVNELTSTTPIAPSLPPVN